MKKFKVGIIGYGNLGKAVEKQIVSSEEFDLIAIFSRRENANTKDFKDMDQYIGKIDLMFLCVGSQNDLEKVAYNVVKNFNTIDCYDNHNRLRQYIQKQNQLAIKNKKIALCALGWDPGLFSYMRGLFDSLDLQSCTFWGKGLSQGHTQAIKNLPNVIDAIQFTVPNNNAKWQVLNGVLPQNTFDLHKRLCYVVCEPQYEKQIKKQIITMPDYFADYKTTVKFVTQQEIDKIKTFAHKGEVVAMSGVAEFKLNLKSNPEFTAKVLVSFARAVPKLKEANRYGAFTVFDLPLNLILKKEKSHFI